MLAALLAALCALVSLAAAVVVWCACALAGRADAAMERAAQRRPTYWTED